MGPGPRRLRGGHLTASSCPGPVTKHPGASGAALHTHKAFSIRFVTFLVALTVPSSGLTSASTASSAVASDRARGFGPEAGTTAVIVTAVTVLALFSFVGCKNLARMEDEAAGDGPHHGP